jgi:putative peptide zinc metalloprotease protein
MGARCGSFGLLFLCGIPCPFCDVTDIWRQTSTVRRIAVMAAGIYVEWIIAAMATLIWLAADDPSVRFTALNLMVLCGISTVLFNANPLMRYDGYYVLADLVGSTDLRSEAADAFGAVVLGRIAGHRYAAPVRSDRRSLFLASYFVASAVYRIMVWAAIGGLLIAVADKMHIRQPMIFVLILGVSRSVSRLVRRAIGTWRGCGDWADVPRWRRGFAISLLIWLLLAILFTPLPRYRTVDGHIDAATAKEIYVSVDGMVGEVWADFGAPVDAGQELCQLRNADVMLEERQLAGAWELARLRTDLTRRTVLSGSSRTTQSASQWPVLNAAEQTLAVRLASVRNRLSGVKLRAPIAGILIPSEPTPPQNEWAEEASLSQRIGRDFDSHVPWCRISADGKLHAVLVIDARDREHILVGSPVSIVPAIHSHRTFASAVESVSEITDDRESVTRAAVYRVLCPLPRYQGDELLMMIGSDCRGVFRLPRQTLAGWLTSRLGEWICGAWG